MSDTTKSFLDDEDIVPTPNMNKIANLPDRSEVRSWERKCVSLAKMLQEMEPFDEQILAIIRERQPLIQEIEDLRAQMVQECIHPIEHLVDRGDFVHCKFCDRKLSAL